MLTQLEVQTPQALDAFDLLEIMQEDRQSFKNIIEDIEHACILDDKTKRFVINRYYCAIDELNKAINEVDSANNNIVRGENDS